MSTRYEFIINPRARSGRGQKIWNLVRTRLEKQHADYGVHVTKGRGHAEKIAAAISSSGRVCTIVVLGGDGTVNEVMNGLEFSENITFGYIPVGSGNDFARGLGIPEKPKHALKAVLFPKKIIRMDVGVLSGNGISRRFAVSSGIGFDASVCRAAGSSRWKSVLNRLHLGKLTYAAVGAGRLLKDKPVRAEVVSENGKRRYFRKMFFAAFMNLPFEGGGFRFCPDAVSDDGLIDVFIVSDISKLKMLFLLPAAYLGKRLRFRGITRIRCRTVRIRTGVSAAVHTDGETHAGWKTAEISLLEKKLKVIAG